MEPDGTNKTEGWLWGIVEAEQAGDTGRDDEELQAMAQMRRWGPSQDWGTTTAWDGSMSSVTASPELFYSVTFSSLHFPGLLGIDHIRPSLLFKTEFLIIHQTLLSICFVPGPVPALRTLAQTGPESSAELTVQWAVKYMPPTSRPWEPHTWEGSTNYSCPVSAV